MEQGIIYQIKVERDNIIARKDEVYRYLGYSKDAVLQQEDSRVEELVLEAMESMGRVLSPQAVYAEYPMKRLEKSGSVDFSINTLSSTTDDNLHAYGIDLGFTVVYSKDLAICLQDCDRIVVFAATIGPAVDLLIQRNSRMNPLKGVIAQATGAMYVEELCDIVTKQINQVFSARGFCARPRFSPGYGDLTLSCQKEIFKALSCPQKIGLTLMDTLIMAPSKSVTAIIGYRKNI